MPVSPTDPRYIDEHTRGVIRECAGCHQTKPIVEFAKDSAKKTGYRSRCLVCGRASNKRAYDASDKTQRRAALSNWQDKNRAYVNAYMRKRKNPNEEFTPKGRPIAHESYEASQEVLRPWYAAYVNRRLKTDLAFRLKGRLSGRIRYAIAANSKAANTLSLLGCTIP